MSLALMQKIEKNLLNQEMNKFIGEKYDKIILMAKKICKSNPEYEDVAHFAIEQFMTHERGQELVDAGRGMQFLSGIMWRSFNSSTSQYHTIYRQKGRMHSLKVDRNNMNDSDNIDWTQNKGNRRANQIDVDEYDYEQDIVTGVIQGILEDMQQDREGELYIRSMLFQMWIKESNFSELSRITHIPRTSIAQYVSDAKSYIQQKLKEEGIDYE